jgi:hypothetical protein
MKEDGVVRAQLS